MVTLIETAATCRSPPTHRPTDLRLRLGDRYASQHSQTCCAGGLTLFYQLTSAVFSARVKRRCLRVPHQYIRAYPLSKLQKTASVGTGSTSSVDACAWRRHRGLRLFALQLLSPGARRSLSLGLGGLASSGVEEGWRTSRRDPGLWSISGSRRNLASPSALSSWVWHGAAPR